MKYKPFVFDEKLKKPRMKNGIIRSSIYTTLTLLEFAVIDA